jgi:hypothetical protein
MFRNEGFNTNQVSVQGTPTQIVPANSGRDAILITNTSSTAIYIGASSSVSTSNGHYLPGTAGASVSIPTTGAIWAISSGGAVTVTYLEVVE